LAANATLYTNGPVDEVKQAKYYGQSVGFYEKATAGDHVEVRQTSY